MENSTQSNSRKNPIRLLAALAAGAASYLALAPGGAAPAAAAALAIGGALSWLARRADFSGYRQLLKAGPDRFLVVFLLLLPLLPLADKIFLFSKRHPLSENRPSAFWPEFKLSSFLGIPRALENYHSDHFGMRALFLRAYGAISLGLLNNSPIPAVLIGTESWLFLAQEEPERDCIDYFRGLRPFSEGEMRHWQSIFRERSAWLKKRGIEYLVVFAPDKATIYPEFLPLRVRSLRGKSRLDQLLAFLGSDPGFRTLDLRPVLLAAKGKRQAYFKTDSHWNQWGAYAAYSAIIGSLPPGVVSSRPIPLKRFSINRRTLSGDLAKMMLLTPPPQETCEELAPRFSYLPLRNIRAEGNPFYCQAGEQEAPGMNRLVMLLDSYGNFMISWLADHFRRSVFYLDRSRFFPLELIEREKPAVVIDEIAERFLLGFTPANPPEISRRRNP